MPTYRGDVHYAEIWDRTASMRSELQQIATMFERLTGEPLRGTTPAGIQELVDAKVPEGDQLDYKRDAYDGAGSDGGKKDELRKDVTALANARGGVLVLGVADSSEGVPQRVLGLSGSLEDIEGRIRQTLASNVEPYLEVEMVQVHGKAGEPSCLLIVVPRSPRRPHAVRPVADPTALKFAKRGGPHTAWLSESQLADAYRDRFVAARSQIDRLDQVLGEAREILSKRAWLILGLVPEMEGDLTVSRATVATVDEWVRDFSIPKLLPDRPRTRVNPASIGPGQVRIAGHDATTVPSESFAALYTDGSVVVSSEMDGPGGNPSVFLDHLVADTLEALAFACGLSLDVAGSGGTAAVRLIMHAEGEPTFICWDPSWSPSQLPGQPTKVQAEVSVDMNAIVRSPADLVAAGAMLTARVANHFGEVDSRYLSHDGMVRVNMYEAPVREEIIPRAVALEVPFTREL